MSEVEKMYENTGCELGCCKNAEYGYVGEEGTWYYCKKEGRECWTYPDGDADCVEKDYPPFTAEKQLELIKWLCKNTYRNYLMIRYNFTNYYWQIECNMVDSNKMDKFSECIANIINEMWQDLTEQERTEIADILKG